MDRRTTEDAATRPGQSRGARLHLQAGGITLAALAVLGSACAAQPPSMSGARPAYAPRTDISAPGLELGEPYAMVAPEVPVPAPATATDEPDVAPTAESPEPAPATPPAGVPYADEVERWRGEVRSLLQEAQAEGRLRGAGSTIDEDLILALIQQESGGDPEAESDAGALGLMQLMPETFAFFMGIHDWGEDVGDVSREMVVDVPSNLRAGIRALDGVLDEQGGSLYWALASYNAGGGVVNSWRAAGFSAVPGWGAYEETANYAPAILSNYAAHRPDKQVSVPDPAMPPPPPSPPPPVMRAPAPLRPAAPVVRAAAPAAQRAPVPVRPAAPRR